jgi:hypothetical protein
MKKSLSEVAQKCVELCNIKSPVSQRAEMMNVGLMGYPFVPLNYGCRSYIGTHLCQHFSDSGGFLPILRVQHGRKLSFFFQ